MRDLEDFDEPAASFPESPGLSPTRHHDHHSNDLAGAAAAEQARTNLDDHEARYGDRAPRRSEFDKHDR